ncbi:translation initiation factor IF-2-like [Panicum virgatum]|uniref:translation initiation factor IF-2-like n=1 Tax=Panicum virgatum TaxID=38727 RepID=UPI0019D50A1D|nr:translation initiation factor IF-2-like [Panicum virgatum]
MHDGRSPIPDPFPTTRPRRPRRPCYGPGTPAAPCPAAQPSTPRPKRAVRCFAIPTAVGVLPALRGGPPASVPGVRTGRREPRASALRGGAKASAPSARPSGEGQRPTRSASYPAAVCRGRLPSGAGQRSPPPASGPTTVRRPGTPLLRWRRKWRKELHIATAARSGGEEGRMRAGAPLLTCANAAAPRACRGPWVPAPAAVAPRRSHTGAWRGRGCPPILLLRMPAPRPSAAAPAAKLKTLDPHQDAVEAPYPLAADVTTFFEHGGLTLGVRTRTSSSTKREICRHIHRVI